MTKGYKGSELKESLVLRVNEGHGVLMLLYFTRYLTPSDADGVLQPEVARASPDADAPRRVCTRTNPALANDIPHREVEAVELQLDGLARTRVERDV